jgi:quinol monooxygenase YgiN
MYGTIAKLKVKPGQGEAMKSHMASVSSRQAPGFLAVNVYQMDADPNELYLTVMFENKETYVANARRPETDADFKRMMQFLVAEPEWHDGEVVHTAWANRGKA